MDEWERPIDVKDALSYLDIIKASFKDWPQVYSQFLGIMRNFKDKIINTPEVITRVCELFSSQPTLIQRFNTFLPTGYHIECTECEDGGHDVAVMTLSGTTTTHYSPPAYPNHVNGGLQLCPRVSEINPFDDAFKATLEDPASSAARSHAVSQTIQGVEFHHALGFINTIKDHFSQDEDTYEQFLQILQKYQKEEHSSHEVFDQVSVLFRGHLASLSSSSCFFRSPQALASAPVKISSEIMKVHAIPIMNAWACPPIQVG
ncbi:hypothetical protein DL93DRAFT_971886 [Clavulina sp. PMI_390]|nr:hypothetical protein DL93DRAFT_971886 [Clavulina sp. PMI_390]